MSITFVGAGSYGSGNTNGNVVASYPAGLVAGDLMVFEVTVHEGPGHAESISDQNGWVVAGVALGNTGSTNTDSGPTQKWYLVKQATGDEGASQLITVDNVTNTTGGTSHFGRIYAFRRSAGTGWATAFAAGRDNTTGTNWSVTFDTDPGLQSGDYVVVSAGFPTDAASGVTWSSEVFSAPGITMGAITSAINDGKAAGLDSGARGWVAAVTAGASTDVPTWTATLSSGTNMAGPAAILRVREDGGITPVSDDLDLRWRVHTRVTDDVSLSWRTRVEVSDTVDLRWGVAVPVTSDVDLRWRVTQRVTADMDVRWRVAERVQSDVEALWRVFVPVTVDTDLRWRTRALVTVDETLRWRVRQQVSDTVHVQWLSFIEATADIDLRWITESTTLVAARDLSIQWRTFSRAVTEVDLRWCTLTELFTDLDIRWAVAVQVSSDVDLRWVSSASFEVVSALLDLRWLVAGVVGGADLVVVLTPATVLVQLTTPALVVDLDSTPTEVDL